MSDRLRLNREKRQQVPYRTVWLLKSGGIHKVSAQTGRTLLVVRDSKGVRKLAIDDGAGIVWAVGPKLLLRGFWFDGRLAHRGRVPSGLGSKTDLSNVEIEVDISNGNVWMAVNRTLLRFDQSGVLQSKRTFPRALRSLSADFHRSRLFVAMANAIVAIDSGTGDELIRIQLPVSVRAVSLSVEPFSGKVWAIAGKMIRAYDSSGNLISQVTVKNVGLIAASPSGGAWIATGNRVGRLSPSGNLLFEVQPFIRPQKIVSLALDRAANIVWASSMRNVSGIRDSKEIVRLNTSSKQPHRLLRLSHSPNSPPDFGEKRGPGVVLFFDGTAKLWRVADIWRGSAGQQAGIRIGDAMLAYNGIPMPVIGASSRMHGILRALDQAYTHAGTSRAGNTDRLLIKRGSKTLEVTVQSMLMRAQGRFAMVSAILGIDDDTPSFCFYPCSADCPHAMQGHMFCFEPHEGSETPPACSGSCSTPCV